MEAKFICCKCPEFCNNLISHRSEDVEDFARSAARFCRIRESHVYALPHIADENRAFVAGVVTDRDHILERSSNELVDGLRVGMA